MANRNFLDEIKKTYKRHRRKRRYPPHDKFLVRYNAAEDVLNVVLEASENSETRNEARKNFIVNLVTAVELFCNEIILYRKSKWNKDGLTKLLNDKEKINLNDFFALAEIGQLSKEYFVIRYYSFQNLESINKVFSLLTGEVNEKGDFLFIKRLAAMKIADRPEGTINSAMPEWVAHFSQLFETRHKIIHEGATTPLKKKDVSNMEKSLDLFTWACFVKFELEAE